MLLAWPTLGVRLVASIFIALAMLVAPVSVLQAATFMPGHSTAMPRAGDCSMSHGKMGSHHQKEDKLCCASVSAALVLPVADPFLAKTPAPVLTGTGVPALCLRYPSEMATPPPRGSRFQN